MNLMEITRRSGKKRGDECLGGKIGSTYCTTVQEKSNDKGQQEKSKKEFNVERKHREARSYRLSDEQALFETEGEKDKQVE